MIAVLTKDSKNEKRLVLARVYSILIQLANEADMQDKDSNRTPVTDANNTQPSSLDGDRSSVQA